MALLSSSNYIGINRRNKSVVLSKHRTHNGFLNIKLQLRKMHVILLANVVYIFAAHKQRNVF